jgi:hypothetical protein
MTLIPELERDLVEAAERGRLTRARVRRVAAAGVAVAAAVAVALVTFSWSGDHPGPKRATGGERPGRQAPPRYHPPMPGTLVRLSSFSFAGVRYRLSGYRSRHDMVCMQIEQWPPESGAADRRPSVTCSGEPSLRRGLRRGRVLNVGGGGGERVVVTGFTRAGVSRIKAVGTKSPLHVELTRPFRPWNGPPIRAYTIVVKEPPGTDTGRATYFRIRAVPADR